MIYNNAEREIPPSGVKVMSWSRNCPHCIDMCVNPLGPFSALEDASKLVCLCIPLETFLGDTLTTLGVSLPSL